jgi:hypothetical protein
VSPRRESGELIEQQRTGDERTDQPDRCRAMSRVSKNATTRCVYSRSLSASQRASQHSEAKANCAGGQEGPNEANVLRDRLRPADQRLCLHVVPRFRDVDQSITAEASSALGGNDASAVHMLFRDRGRFAIFTIPPSSSRDTRCVLLQLLSCSRLEA